MADATLRMLLLGEDRGASKALDKVGRSAEDTDGRMKKFSEGLPDLGARMSKIMTVAGAVGPAVMAGGAAMSAAAAGAVALGGAVGPAAAGGLAVYASALLAVKSAGMVAKFAMDGVSKAAAGDKKAMAKLTPEGQKLAKTIAGLKPQMDSVRTASQRGLFPGLTKSISLLGRSYFPMLRTAARQTGTALGTLALRGAKMAATGPWRRDFGTVTKANAKNIGLMGVSGLHLANAARSLLVTGMPLVTMFLKWSNGATKSLDAWVQNARASGRLAAFWRTAADNGAALGHILGNLFVGLGRIFKIGGAGQGKIMLTNLEGISAQFRSWTASEGGRKSIAEWFKTGRTNLEAMGRLLATVTTGLSSMGSGKQLAPLVDQIRTQVIPPLMEFLHNASASGALSTLVGAVGKVVAVFAQLSASDGSLKAFAKTLDILATAAGWIVKNVPGAGTVLGAFFTVAGTGAALKFAGLGGVVSAFGNGLVVLAGRLGLAAGAADAETGAITANSIVRNISRSTLATWLGVKALELGAWIRSTAAAGANAVATLAAATASKVAAGAAKMWAAGQWLLNAAMDANPIGLVVLAIAALVAGFIIAYKKSETFRKVVQFAMHAVAGYFTFLWNNAARPALLAIGKALGFVMSMWAKMLGALGHIPGFGWAKTASRWMQGAADTAWNLGDKIKKIPGSKRAVVVADVYGKANVDALQRSINQLRGRTVNVKATTSVAAGNGMYMSGRAVGGPVRAGKTYLVGERGPERVTFAQSGRVSTAAETARVARPESSGSGDFEGTFALELKLDGKTMQTVLLKHKRKNGNVSLGLA